MKRQWKEIILGITITFIAYIGYFYYENLRGIGPAVNPPPENIAKTENTTGLPLKIPEGSYISIYVSGLNSPRVLAYGPNGMVVSEMNAGQVTALFDDDGDEKAERKVPVITGLNRPHGIAFRCPSTGSGQNEPCKIYIAETHRVVEYDYDAINSKAINGKKIVDLPSDGGHHTRTLLFMPYPDEDNLLISVGSSCNVCHEEDSRRAKILKYNVITGELAEFAKGLRNTVFMAIHPVTGKIWGTDMGRDLLGDDTPPEEINIIEEGKNYGWPICYGKNIHDTAFDKNTYIRNPCMEPFEMPSHIDMQAHSAPLGLAFIPEEGWPEDMWYNLLVAFHGSWNRSVPTGYKIVKIKLDAEGNVLGEPEDFITGWLTDEGALGRPVDILVQPGGTIYISDDKAGVIYLVKRTAAL